MDLTSAPDCAHRCLADPAQRARIGDIALRCGFAQAHFARQFRTAYGTTDAPSSAGSVRIVDVLAVLDSVQQRRWLSSETALNA
jgi:AraC-like DNA-binding protein